MLPANLHADHSNLRADHAFPAGLEDDYPNEENILDLVLRKGLGKDDEDRAQNEKRLDNLIDKIYPKICGNSRWSPTIRHCKLPSSVRPSPSKDNPNPNTHVTVSDEAFAVWVLENKCPSWKNPFDLSRLDSDAAREKHKETNEYKEAEKTPYTDPKAGQKKFGGVTDKGWKRHKLIHKMIVENREERAEEIKKIEEEAPKRIRIANNREEIDEKRKAKKRKSTNPPVEEEEVEDEDMTNWC